MSKVNCSVHLGGIHRATIGWVQFDVFWQGPRGVYNLHCQAPPIRCALKTTDIEGAKAEALELVVNALRRQLKRFEGAEDER